MQKLITVTKVATTSLVASVLLVAATLANAAPAHGEEIIEASNAPVTQETVVPEVVIAPAPAAPAYDAGLALLAAARSQLGVRQDCTALVEKSLRSIGFSVGDLGPMDFGGYGTRVTAADAKPGDIMMRWGHVAIYAGNGVAVQGGFEGRTVETSTDGSPSHYAVIIRLS